MVKKSSCDLHGIHDVIMSCVPHAKLESNVSAELSYTLPNESCAQFEELFTALEQQQTQLGIQSFGASVTTMEEVFLRVGEIENIYSPEENNPGSVATSTQRFENGSFDTEGNFMYNKNAAQVINMEPAGEDLGDKNTGPDLYFQQFWAMFVKRILTSWRSPFIAIVQVVCPAVFTIIGCAAISLIPGQGEPQNLVLEFDNYEDPVNPYTAFENDDSSGVTGLVFALTTYLTGKAEVQEVNIDTWSNLSDFLIDKGNNDIDSYMNNYMTAHEIVGAIGPNSTAVTAMFNNEAYHTPALALNVFGNTMLRYFTTASKSITVSNHPLPKPPSLSTNDNLQVQQTTAFVTALNIIFGISFLMATFILNPIKERSTKAKHCQFASGVGVTSYWLSAFFWDLINYVVASLGIIIVIAAFQVEGYTYQNNLGVVFLLLLCYGLAVPPVLYLFSFLFDIPSSGYVATAFLNIYTGIPAMLAVYILKLPYIGTQSVALALEWVFYISMPTFCMGNGLQEMYNNFKSAETCREFEEAVVQNGAANVSDACDDLSYDNPSIACCPDHCGDYCAVYTDNYLAWSAPGVGRAVFFLILQSIGCFMLLFFIDSGGCRQLQQKMFYVSAISSQKQPEVAPEEPDAEERIVLDEDVRAEQERIIATGDDLRTLGQTQPIVLAGIQKFYGGFLAVNRLSLGVPRGECFGLLGVNGAGKTTVFKMLTGDENMSSGQAYICGYNVATNIKAVQQRIGYCPQFDALLEKLTVEENLTLFARLRGIQETKIPYIVQQLMKKLLLDQYADKQAEHLSGGNKRKLSCGLALVGDPPVVFLDEPTTGMDPAARRHLWNILSQVRESGRTLVLTSHSMEECEALCTSLAIMVNGQFKCLGSPQHLKNKFGKGFSLAAQTSPCETTQETVERTDRLKQYIEENFPNAILKDRHGSLLIFQIPSSDTLGWASAFGKMERAKKEYHIANYSVSQTSLEQVFINFAKLQRPPVEENIDSSTKCRSCCFICCCCGCCRSYEGIKQYAESSSKKNASE